MRPKIGRSANWLAAMAAVAPDLDTFAGRYTQDPWVSIIVHRGTTHSLLLSPLMALAFAGLFWLFRRRQFWPMFALALIGVVSHIVLDVFTSYGTQIIWPISSGRFAIDALPIVDFFYTPILGLAVIGCWLSRRLWVSLRVAVIISVAGLALSTAYAGAGQWANMRTRQLAMETVPADPGQVVAARSTPMIGSIFARRLVIKTAGGFHVARYNVLTSAGPPVWVSAGASDDEFVRQADQLPRISVFRWFAMGLARPEVARSEGNGRALVRVSYHDMRYGYPADATESLFVAYVIFDEQTREILDGPATKRGSSVVETGEDWAKFFPPPTQNGQVLSGGYLQRLAILWHEAWRP